MRRKPTTLDEYPAALRFDPKEGLPGSLVRKLIKARIAETKERR